MCLDPCHPGTYTPPTHLITRPHTQPIRNATTTGGFLSGGWGLLALVLQKGSNDDAIEWQSTMVKKSRYG